ncbi:MAG TPA: PAS domain S-box protein [Symbiobacteriaceae bacterium]|nr:PAS domain S-box protein [Symbiobacteriaceae bacterium]
MNHSTPAKSGTFGPPPRLFRQPVIVRRVLEGAILAGMALLLPLLADWDWSRSPLLLLGCLAIAATLAIPAILRSPWLLAGLTAAGCLLIGLVVPDQSTYVGPMHLMYHAVLARNAPFLSWPVGLGSAILLEGFYLGVRSLWSAPLYLDSLLEMTAATDTLAKMVLVTLAKSWYDMNQAVRRSALELTAVTSSAAHLICTLDRNGTVRSVNGASRPLLGFEPEEVTGQNYSVVFGSELTPDEKRLGRLIDAGEPVYHLLKQIPCKDGTVVWLEWNLQPIPELDAILCVGRQPGGRDSA